MVICLVAGVTAIEPEWLPVILPQLCTFSKPLEKPAPTYEEETGTVHCHMTSTFGTLARNSCFPFLKFRARFFLLIQ